MRRSAPFRFRVQSCCLLLWSLFLTGCAGEADTAHRRAPGSAPDIVLVLIDTLRADHLGVYSDSRPISPNLDALAADGVCRFGDRGRVRRTGRVNYAAGGREARLGFVERTRALRRRGM